MELCTILLKEDVAVDPRTYGDLLAPALGVTVHDARMAVRRGGGIFAENLPEDQARGLADALQADGIDCWCAPASALPAIQPARRATSVETNPDGIRCALLGQPEPVELPWDRIGVVSIGLVLVPELQEEIAGVRKKDVAAVARLEREQRDLVRDRLIAHLTKLDLSHQENAPAAAAHHYYFDQLRRRESKQLKAFADLVSDDGEWWRLPLEESNFTDRSDGSSDGGSETANYFAVPVIYRRLKEAHSERSRKLLQGGNVERLVFHTMEEFNRYTRWWAWRERLRLDPGLAPPSQAPSSGGNGRAPVAISESRDLRSEAPARLGSKGRAWALVGCLTLVMFLAVGLKFEKRGADCLICGRNRQDDVVRVWGYPLKEKLGEWTRTGPSSYDVIVGKDHEHLFTGFGYEREGLIGIGSGFGRTLDGNASPEEVDAAECVRWLIAWHSDGQASVDEVRDAYPRLFQRVRSIPDAAGRRRWLDLARAPANREAPENLLKELSK